MHSVWPSHSCEKRPYQAKSRLSSKEGRLCTEIEISIPPFISELPAVVPDQNSKQNISEITFNFKELLAKASWPTLKAFRSFMIRSESLASSRVEGIVTRRRDFAKVILGYKASDNAKLTLSAIEATNFLAIAVHEKRKVEESDILAAHKILMEADPYDYESAGKYRPEQNWIGGGDAPCGAMYVPPSEDLVPTLMGDLVAFCNREDIDPVIQAIIAHAQFESIHPFVDGNGRIGRALITGLLNKGNVNEEALILPFSSAILADIKRYYETLTSYRTGKVNEVIEYFTEGCLKVFPAVDTTMLTLSELSDRLKEVVKPRKNSVLEGFIEVLPENPVLDAELARELLGISNTSNVYPYMEKLVEAGVLEPVLTTKRKQSWYVPAVFDEMDAMQTLIGARQVFEG